MNNVAWRGVRGGCIEWKACVVFNPPGTVWCQFIIQLSPRPDSWESRGILLIHVDTYSLLPSVHWLYYKHKSLLYCIWYCEYIHVQILSKLVELNLNYTAMLLYLLFSKNYTVIVKCFSLLCLCVYVWLLLPTFVCVLTLVVVTNLTLQSKTSVNDIKII